MNRLLIRFISLTSCVLLTGCWWLQEPVTTNDSEVKRAWALKNFMMKWDISPVVELEDLDQEALYALWAYGNLKWEIMILDGQSFWTKFNGTSIDVDNTIDDTSSLLVYANASSRTEYKISSDLSWDELEKTIKEKAEQHGINVTNPFIFRLVWVTKYADYHVIDRDEEDNEHTHEKHVESWYQWSFSNQEVEILWFYSETHQWVFTHHSSFVHMHIRSEENQLGGHVDKLTIGEMKLLLPN